ncbi:hypothetical protein SynMEDNS5_01748 [Synechococcus sp. MEDNS5]|nr:hypothetical protein SynMEDNS5_01748 [Synechococcus sp. MEDNS5]
MLNDQFLRFLLQFRGAVQVCASAALLVSLRLVQGMPWPKLNQLAAFAFKPNKKPLPCGRG